MATLAPGRVIGDYVLLRPLSQGGFGEVYEARDPRTQHRVALKVLHRERMNEAMLAKFTHEALISNRVSDSSRFVPKVVRADVDRELGRAWLAMEFIDGPTLAHAAAQGQRWSPREVIEVLYCVADALSAAHASDLVHCDIKPENVVIQRSPTPERAWVAYVLDFGIARLRTDLSARAPSTMAATLLWAAPEQLGQQGVTPASDQYAFALLAFWMLVGAQIPITESQRTTPSQWASQRGVALPAGFDAWYGRATRHAPNERFESVRRACLEFEHMFSSQAAAHAPTEAQRANPYAATQSAARVAVVAPTQRARAPLNKARIAAIAGVTALSVGGLGLYGATREPGREAPNEPRSVSSPPTVRASWTPPTRLTVIEPDFQPLTAQPALLAAATRWQRFVESYGATDASEVYTPQFRLRTMGTRTPAQATTWWNDWHPNGEQIFVSLAHARVLERPANADTDAPQCRGGGPVWEMRVPVRESKPNMDAQQLSELPCPDFQAIYTVRWLRWGRDFRVCHENWRSADLCAACPSANACP